MTTPAAPAAPVPPPPQSQPRKLHAAPFLVWPVSRRAFYQGLWISLILPICWGLVIYGVRDALMVGASIGAATFTHTLLKRWLRWERGKCLLYAHTLAATMILVALARPTWPAWIVAASALMLPAVLALLGGPGKERVHIAIAAVLLIQYVFLPWMAGHTYTDRPDAILARDRLFMGDIRDQHASSVGTSERWPASRDLGGNDAIPVKPPAVAAADVLNEMSTVLRLRPPDAGLPTPDTVADLRAVVDRAVVSDLVPMDRFLLGIAPNRMGAASLIGIVIAGLFLAYRYILRPRSVVFFSVMFIVASATFAFTPGVVHAVGIASVADVIRQMPAQFTVLLTFLILNSDAPFAAVFLLALPGAEPLTPRGRRVFLAVVAVLAAGLHRLDPAAPAATLIICLFTPLAPYFDRIFGARSWLDAR